MARLRIALDRPVITREPAPTLVATPAPISEAPAPPPAALEPPTSAPPITDDGIDHSTDASPDADHQRAHRHRQASRGSSPSRRRVRSTCCAAPPSR